MEGYKHKYLKSKGFDSFQEMFDRAFKRVNTFEDFTTELVEGKEKRVGAELVQESTKKQKVEDEKETAEIKKLIEIIPDEEEVAIHDIPLAIKSPSIVEWKIHKEGRKNYYQIIRADGKSQMYMIFSHMLKSFDRSKDEAPEVIKIFLKQIQVLLQALVIINDHEDIGKLGAKGDIGFFIGYSNTFCAYRVYNRRTKKVMKTMNFTFDELSVMAFEQHNSKPELQGMTYRPISSGLNLTYASSTIISQKLIERDLELLFEANDYMSGQPSDAIIAPAAPATLNCQTPNTYTTTAKTTPTPTHSSTMAPVIPNTS
ncbi:hypothetical protein Tco_1020446 [Tanacetum coccineum]